MINVSSIVCIFLIFLFFFFFICRKWKISLRVTTFLVVTFMFLAHISILFPLFVFITSQDRINVSVFNLVYIFNFSLGN